MRTGQLRVGLMTRLLHSRQFRVSEKFQNQHWACWLESDLEKTASNTQQCPATLRRMNSQKAGLPVNAREIHHSFSIFEVWFQADWPEMLIDGVTKIESFTKEFVKSIRFPLDSCSVQSFLRLWTYSTVRKFTFHNCFNSLRFFLFYCSILSEQLAIIVV